LEKRAGVPGKVEKCTLGSCRPLRKRPGFATNKPSAIQWGEPVDAMPAGSVVSQAITQLWSITGNIDNPGGNVIARNSHGVTTYPFSSAELTELYGADLVKRLNEKRIGANDYPMIKLPRLVATFFQTDGDGQALSGQGAGYRLQHHRRAGRTRRHLKP
jgi:anaerobic selenocysteine-containing dehydrogenase